MKRPVDDDDLLESGDGGSDGGNPFDRTFVVERDLAGIPLDRFLSNELPDLDRTYLRQLVREGRVRVDGVPMTSSRPLWRNAVVNIAARPDEDVSYQKQVVTEIDAPFPIVYENADVAIINKPAGVTLDPKLLMERCPTLHAPKGDLLRPAEKVDRETSGLVVITKNLAVSRAVQEIYNSEKVNCEVLAIVEGSPDEDSFVIKANLGADERHTGRRVVDGEHAERAETEIYVMERFDGFTAIVAKPRTHRTHQIRAHLQHLVLPVVGDPLYNHKAEITVAQLKRGFEHKAGHSEKPMITRMAMHIQRIQFQSPAGEAIDAKVDPPRDLDRFIKSLHRYRPLRYGR
ncbi:MAG: pseudouridine synthase [Planctomycetota bacterium]